MLAFSDVISSWTPLKPQHSNPKANLNPLANKLWCINFPTTPTPLIIPHRLPAFLESLMPLKNWCSIHARCSKSNMKHFIRFCGSFSKFKNSILLHIVLLKCPHVQIAFFKIHLLRQSGFSRVDSNCYCRFIWTWIIKFGQSSHKMYSNNILNFQEFTPILNACIKMSGNLLNQLPTYIHIYIYIYIYIYYIYIYIYY